MLIEIVREAHIRDFRGVIFRKTIKELARLIDKSKEIYPFIFPGAKFNNSEKIWHFPSGAKILMCSLQSKDDKFKHQGMEYGCVCFDEATQFDKEEIMYLMSRTRSTNPLIRPRMRYSANPGGISHGFFKERFIDNGAYNRITEDTEVVDPQGKKMIFKRSRIFIPSSVFDNKYLCKTDYLANLSMLPEKERDALLYGKWNVFTGQYFPEFKHNIHVIQPQNIQFKERFRALDYGFDGTFCIWCGVTNDNQIIVYRELSQKDLTISDAAKKILAMTPADEKISYTVVSPDLFNRRQETGKSGQVIMQEAGLYGIQKANDSRIQGWRNVREYLKPINCGDSYTAKLQIFSTCHNLITNIPNLIHDTNKVEDCSSQPHDQTHGPEALRYGLMSRNTELNGEQYKKIFNRI